MKLSDITNIYLTEVDVHRTSQVLDFVDPVLNDLSELIKILKNTKRTIEGFKLYSAQFEDEIIFALVKDEQIFSVLVAKFIKDFPSDKKMKTIQLERTWTPPEQRNRGYSSALVSGLTKFGFRVVSNKQLSPQALGVWKKIKRVFNVKAFDWDMLQYTVKNPETDSNVSFVLEQGAPYYNGGILHERKWFTNSSLGVMEKQNR